MSEQKYGGTLTISPQEKFHHADALGEIIEHKKRDMAREALSLLMEPCNLQVHWDTGLYRDHGAEYPKTPHDLESDCYTVIRLTILKRTP